MNASDRHRTLATLGWKTDETAGRHQICGERCKWIMGDIAGVAHSAWMSDVSGMVYLHMKETKPGEYDFTFDDFCKIVVNGWPVAKVAPAARSLFGDDE